MPDAESSEVPISATGAHSGVAAELNLLVHIALAGLLGAGTVVTYFAITLWVVGWRSHPRYAGFEWENWLLLSIFGIGLISIVVGIGFSVAWFARARRLLEAVFWGVASMVILGLDFVAVVATILAPSRD